jgi:hypothetical protein
METLDVEFYELNYCRIKINDSANQGLIYQQEKGNMVTIVGLISGLRAQDSTAEGDSIGRHILSKIQCFTILT